MQDDLRVKTAMITRLREQLEHKLKVILDLKAQLRKKQQGIDEDKRVQELNSAYLGIQKEYNAVVTKLAA